MNFNNFSLRVKLIGGFFTVLALLGAVAIISFTALNGSSRGFEEYREMARDSNLTGELDTNMLMVRMNVKNFIINGSEASRKQYQVYYEKIDELLKEAQKEINAPDRARKIDEIAGLHLQYNDAFHKVVKIEENTQRNNLVTENLDKIVPRIAVLADEVHLSIQKTQDEIGPRLQASNTRAVSLIIIASLAALGAGLVLVFFIISSVLNQLGGDPSEIAWVVRRIADGNLAMEDRAGKKGKSTGVYHDMSMSAWWQLLQKRCPQPWVRLPKMQKMPTGLLVMPQQKPMMYPPG